MKLGRIGSTFAAAFAVPLLTLAAPAAAQSSCGSETVVAAGETLADVAARCGVSLEALREANPALSTGEIQAGAEVEMPAIAGGGFLGRAREAVREAGEEIEGAATRAGRSVSDYLSENPDLNRDILEFGERLGLPGVAASPEVGADVVVSPASARPGQEVTIRASGLRGDTAATIGAGAPGAESEILERTTTTARGTLEASVAVPDSAADQGSIIFVVETGRVRLTSEPVDVLPE
jgi:hypothetical protein